MKHLAVVLLFVTLAACTSDFTPKPRGYFRIDLPNKSYQVFDTSFPYTFEYPVYARIIPDSSRMVEPYWINIVYTPYHAQLHFSYKVISNNLKQYLEDSRTLVNKHIPKANNIDEERIDIKEHNVHGIIYNIEGEGTASTYQFFVTDSLTNFIRGALYFNFRPNNDSLSPVIDFVKDDIKHLIKTFQWKKL